MAYMDKSKTEEWSTPQELFDDLNREFRFTIDVCASDDNHKCDRYYTKADNGLLQSWNGEIVWCNPPYGRQIAQWVRKAYIESWNGVRTVMRIPARTDTAWFHGYIYGQKEIRFVRGRLRFGDAKATAPFPSMIVIF